MNKILIVDDDLNNLYVLKTVLRGAGYEVAIAINGAEALARARENPPDLIVSDLLMPVMDGYELCRQWKADERLRHAPFIVYTATYTEDANARLATKLGADLFLIKPQEPQVILHIIREMLEGRATDPIADAKPPGDEKATLREYNEILFHKLEKKLAELEAEIIERERAEKAHRASEEKYRELVENANSIIMRRDIAGRITFFNEFAQKFFGYTTGEILGRHVVGTIVPETDSTGRDLVGLIQDISAHPDRYQNNDNENVCRNGARVWIAWTNKAILDSEGRISEILCVGNDITKQKEDEKALSTAETKLRALTCKLARAESSERKRIAVGLHDDVCQMLVVVKTKLGMIATAHQDTTTMADIYAAIDSVMLSLRTLIFDLGPPVLDELGLKAALDWLAERIQRQHGITCNVHCAKPIPPLDEALRTILFLAARELLMNVVKHAQARHVAITLDMDGAVVHVEVEDDGVGLPEKPVGNAGQEGFGLFSIRERVKGLGGSLELFSQAGSGTAAIVSVPLESGKGLDAHDDSSSSPPDNEH